jgi:hypothetical protein
VIRAMCLFFQGQVEEKAIALQEARVNDVSSGGVWLSGRWGCLDSGPAE